ncbi:NAD(P)-dependent alcohol dehydrogenase [Lujinxingia litoralis]|uniref:NAD(P)-dependent alcohol dehydrogenase n=1 Tax=Lujinxingia litoralis TaxID=2211119 RepID=A0A328C6J4_9DELT|nr:NAD(P)-dependent alcohol dehydrogenase [Lujinxingia litoralis]RAL22876.1 NAD(P)-dependent alcohol dehydrogenase [Lujinxingia litoralis]
MKAWRIEGEFGLERLRQVEMASVPVARGQVRLKMRAVGLNYRDLMMIQGRYNPRQPLPLVPCSDGVGEVVEVGPEVDGAWLGRRVSPIFAQGWQSGEPTREKLRTTLGGPLAGTLREEMVCDVSSVVAVPDHLSDAEAASLGCAGVTAWHAVVEQGNVGAGDVVVCLGTGGVSVFAMQFATMMGAEVIMTSSSDAKLARVRELGAAHVINYRQEPQWGRAVKALTGGRGADLVVEVGGAGTLQESIGAVRVGGTIALIGVLAGGMQPLNVVPVLMQNIRVQGVLVGSGEMFERMNRAIGAHRMRPVIDRVVGFDDVVSGFEAMREGAHLGKICVEVS